MAQGNVPDYVVAALDKDTGNKNHRIGAVWNNDDEIPF